MSALANTLAQVGRTKEAIKIFTEAREAASITSFTQAMENTLYIENDLEKAQALCVLAAALTNAGLEAEANRIFMEAKAAAYAVESYGRRESPVCTFVAALCQAGHFDLVKKEVQPLIHNPWHRSEGASSLATPMANIGRFAEGFTTLGLQRLDKFLYDLTEWASAFENVQPRLSLEVMREAVRIAGWVRPQWQDISQLFPDITSI